MEKERISVFIHLGSVVRFLEDLSQGAKVHGDGYALSNLDTFLEYLDELKLPVTEEAARYCRITKLQKELKDSDPDARLTSEQAALLKREMKTVRVVLFAEGGQKMAFVTRDKRFDVDKLLNSPGDLLAPGVFDELSEEIRYDIEEAGKCVAFERPTAAAFHLMRATEGALRQLYCAMVKRERVNPLLWKAMVDHLRRRTRKPPAALLDQLDSIRHNFRNPTQHPDAIYDIQQAQDLWSLSTDAISRCANATPS